MLLKSSRVIDIIPPRAEYRIDALSEKPLEPMEYCKKWVDMSPNDRGYRKACIAALAEATGLSPRTIGNWGSNFEKRPNYAAHILRMADMLNQIKKIVLPPDFPQQ